MIFFILKSDWFKSLKSNTHSIQCVQKSNLEFNFKNFTAIYNKEKDRKQMLPVLWSLADSNRGHTDFQSDALPTELRNLLVGAPFSKSDTNVRHFKLIQNFLSIIFKKIQNFAQFYGQVTR